MKRKIHQRRNLRERKKRPGLENWKRCSELHYMMAWVVHRQVLEVHKKVLEVHRKVSEACRKVWVACRKASDDCRIALF